MINGGWFKESYRHSLAARGIRTSFAALNRYEMAKLREASRRAKVFQPMPFIPDEPLVYTGPPQVYTSPYGKLAPEQMRMIEGSIETDSSKFMGSSRSAPVLTPEHMEKLNEIIAASTAPGAVEMTGRTLPPFMPEMSVEPMFGVGAPSRRAEIAKLTGDLTGLNQEELAYVLDIGLYGDKRLPGYSGQALRYLPSELQPMEDEFRRKESSILAAFNSGQIGALTKDHLLDDVSVARQKMVIQNYNEILKNTNRLLEERRLAKPRSAGVRKSTQSLLSVNIADPFTGKTKEYSYSPGSVSKNLKLLKGESDVYISSSREKMLDKMIANNQEKWMKFMGDLRETEPDLPMANNINQVVDWLSKKRGIDPDVVKESLRGVVSKYKNIGKQSDPFARVTPSSIEIPLTIRERVQEALTGGTYFNTEQDAKVFAAGGSGYQVKQESTDDGDVIYSVSKPLIDIETGLEGSSFMQTSRARPLKLDYKEKLLRQDMDLT